MPQLIVAIIVIILVLYVIGAVIGAVLVTIYWISANFLLFTDMIFSVSTAIPPWVSWGIVGLLTGFTISAYKELPRYGKGHLRFLMIGLPILIVIGLGGYNLNNLVKNKKYVLHELPKIQSTVIVSASKANIRSRPSTSSKIIAKANKGTRLAALETKRNWYKVKFKLNRREKVGWIYKSLVNSQDTAPSQIPEKPQINIVRAVIAEGLDSNKKPSGISDSFSPGKKKLYYYVDYHGAVSNKTMFTPLWFKNGKQISLTGNYKIRSSSGFFYNLLYKNFTPGKYEVRLFADAREVHRTYFNVATLPKPTSPERGKAAKTVSTPLPPPPSPRIEVSSYSLDFGEVKIRKYGSRFSGRNIYKSVYITNTGDADLVINKVTSPKSPFEIKTNECIKNIKPKRRCKIRIAFSPATNFQINEWTTDIEIGRAHV